MYRYRSTVESLLERGFKPTRGVVLTFGFDEEVSGLHGARTLGQYLLSTYGENSFFLLVDEGGTCSCSVSVKQIADGHRRRICSGV